MFEVRVVTDTYYGSYSHWVMTTLEDARALVKLLQVERGYTPEECSITEVKPSTFVEWAKSFYGREDN
jgi:hypothetical protein